MKCSGVWFSRSQRCYRGRVTVYRSGLVELFGLMTCVLDRTWQDSQTPRFGTATTAVGEARPPGIAEHRPISKVQVAFKFFSFSSF